MTEPLAPLSDEDLSAALDGMAGPDVEARLQADPSARERFDALRAASEAIGQTRPAPEPGTFDALIARAIQVGTTPNVADAGPVPTAPDGVVTPLAPRRRSAPGFQRWLVAAVVVVLVAIGLGLVYSGTHDGKTQTTATGAQGDRNTARSDDESTQPNAEGSDEAGGSDAGSSDSNAEQIPSHSADEPPLGAIPDAEPDAQEPADLAQLGSFADKSALRTVLRTEFPTDAAPVVGDRPTNATVDRCRGFAQTVLGDYSLAPEPDEVGYATVAGDTYLVYEFAVTDLSGDASKLITAADPQSCDLLFTFVR